MRYNFNRFLSGGVSPFWHWALGIATGGVTTAAEAVHARNVRVVRTENDNDYRSGAHQAILDIREKAKEQGLNPDDPLASIVTAHGKIVFVHVHWDTIPITITSMSEAEIRQQLGALVHVPAYQNFAVESLATLDKIDALEEAQDIVAHEQQTADIMQAQAQAEAEAQGQAAANAQRAIQAQAEAQKITLQQAAIKQASAARVQLAPDAFTTSQDLPKQPPQTSNWLLPLGLAAAAIALFFKKGKKV